MIDEFEFAKTTGNQKASVEQLAATQIAVRLSTAAKQLGAKPVSSKGSNSQNGNPLQQYADQVTHHMHAC